MDKQEFMEYLEEEYECQVKLWNCDSSDRLQIGKVNLLKEIIDKAKSLDEPEISTEQAWEKIAEEYKLPVETVQQIAGTTISSAVKKEDIAIRDGCIILNPNLTEPEQPKIPKFVAKEIPSAPTEALDRYYNPGVYIVPTYSYKVITWIEEHFDIFLQALVNGFEIQKEPAWVVKINEKLYFCRFTDKYFEKDSNAPTYIESGSPSLIKKFTNKYKAKAVAILVDGTVEEWSE